MYIDSRDACGKVRKNGKVFGTRYHHTANAIG
jgi:hypothetical protein